MAVLSLKIAGKWYAVSLYVSNFPAISQENVPVLTRFFSYNPYATDNMLDPLFVLNESL